MSRKASTVAIADLDSEKADLVSKIINTILSSPRADDTFAQIIDGKPTASGFGPNPESIVLFRAFRTNLRPTDLRINAETAQSFQNSSPSSNEFNLHLLEIVAVAIHTLAVQIFMEFHPDLSYPEADHDLAKGFPVQPSLQHPFYQISYKYPNERADMVGYWAESRLFGGVVLFDHGTSGNEFVAAYLNPSEDIYVFRLSQTQLGQFRGMGETKHEGISNNPLPFPREKDALEMRQLEAFDRNIYRDKFEERPPAPAYKSCVRRVDPSFLEAYREKFPDYFPK